MQLKYNLQSSEDQLVVEWKNKSNEWETISYHEFSEDELKKEWVCLRTQFQLKYSIDNASNYREQLIELLKSTRTKICETNKPIFKVTGTEIILKKDKGLVGIGKNAKISAAVQQTKTNQNVSQSNPNQFETLTIEIGPGDGDDSAAVDDISSIFSSKFDLKKCLILKLTQNVHVIITRWIQPNRTFDYRSQQTSNFPQNNLNPNVSFFIAYW